MGALRKPESFELPPIDGGDRSQGSAAASRTPQSPGPVLLTRLEAPAAFDQAKRISVLRPYPILPKPSEPLLPRIAPSFRKLVFVGVGAVLLAVCLALVLGSSSPQSAAPRPGTPARNTLQTAHPAKPSAYGEAFIPPRPASRSRRIIAPIATADSFATPRN
jgi:hypothetical protein